MSQHKIEAHKITKPIQLLAAWLIGLAIVDIAFLTAASQIDSPVWVPGLLAIAAVLNVPLFVGSMFLLQTKFRPEMQEDAYYSDYLNRKDGMQPTKIQRMGDKNIDSRITELSKKIYELAESSPSDFGDQVKELISEEKVEELTKVEGGSRTLSELYLRPGRWFGVVERWQSSPAFKDDLEELVKHQLIELSSESPFSAKLTDLGEKVAKRAESEGILFAQRNSDFFHNDGF